MNRYEIVLDKSASYLIETMEEHGVDFASACDAVIEYSTDSEYKRQAARWTKIKENGEAAYVNPGDDGEPDASPAVA